MARIDSRQNRREILEAVGPVLPPPHVKLCPRDRAFFNNIIEEFANKDWSQHNLEIACFIARTMGLLERESRYLSGENSVIQTEKGLKSNPRIAVIRTLTSALITYRKTLALDYTVPGAALKYRVKGNQDRDRNKKDKSVLADHAAANKAYERKIKNGHDPYGPLKAQRADDYDEDDFDDDGLIARPN